MVKAGRNKRRRSGRNRVSRKNKAAKSAVTDNSLRKVWDKTLPAAENLARVGLRYNVNGTYGKGSTMGSKKGESIDAETLEEVSFMAIPASDSLDVDRNTRRKPMSDEDQRYIAKLLAAHGTDYQVRPAAPRRPVARCRPAPADRLATRARSSLP